MLVAPTERHFHDLGTSSSIPERYGADFLLVSPSLGKIGVQRKEVEDLVASVNDGRLYKELIQMRALDIGVLLIEGRLQWTADGLLMSKAKWTRAQHLGVVLSANLKGYWTISSNGVDDTREWLRQFTKWAGRTTHKGLTTRPKPTRDEWGTRQSRDWGLHVLMSFDGIGSEVAGAMYDHFGGLPMRWDVTEAEMMEVKGIGKGRARKMMEALERDIDRNETTTTSEDTN